MSSKKIDQLFRDKLEDHAVAPGEQAWAKLQGKMKPASRGPVVWLQVAAAVVLLMVGSWFFLTEKDNSSTEQVASQTESEEVKAAIQSAPEETDSPKVANHSPVATRDTEDAAAMPEASKKRNTVVQPKKVQLASAEQTQQKTAMPVALEEIKKVQDQEEQQVELPENLQSVEMETQIAAATEVIIPAQEVKITYIASEEERFLEPVRELLDSDQPKEKKNGLSKLIASARTITSGDILADIRESKDELFNGNLKLNKDEKVNNSK